MEIFVAVWVKSLVCWELSPDASTKEMAPAVGLSLSQTGSPHPFATPDIVTGSADAAEIAGGCVCNAAGIFKV